MEINIKLLLTRRNFLVLETKMKNSHLTPNSLSKLFQFPLSFFSVVLKKMAVRVEEGINLILTVERILHYIVTCYRIIISRMKLEMITSVMAYKSTHFLTSLPDYIQ